MTRREFENIDTFWELVDAADSAGYEHGYYTEGARDDCVSETLCDMCRSDHWETIRDYLEDIPTGYDYYTQSDYDGAWYGVCDDEFDDFKSSLLDYCLDTGFFEDDEDEADLYDYDGQQETETNRAKDTRSAYAVAERIRLEELSDTPFEEGFTITELFQNDGLNIKVIETTEEDEAEAERLMALMSA